MAIVKMKRMRLLAMVQDREELLRLMQDMGCVEVEEPGTDLTEEEQQVWKDLSLTRVDAQPLSQARERRQRAERALAILKHHGCKSKGFLTPRPSLSREQLFDPQREQEGLSAVDQVLEADRTLAAYQAEGVGIGLYLARQIAAGQGGYLKVESAPGAGSTFSLYLPREG